MAEAAGMGRSTDTIAAAQKAIDYCTELHQSGEGSDRSGWRYSPKQAGDLSVTGWYILALKSAKLAGLRVPSPAFNGAIEFLDRVEIRKANEPSRYGYTVGDEKPESSQRMTAIGNLSRQLLGWKTEELQTSIEYFVEKGGLPSYGANGEAVDLYYWYYATMCLCFHQDTALILQWNEALRSAVHEKMCKGGDDDGSWSPVGVYSNEWGRVGQTALNALIIETYVRYQLIRN